tara:strand:- start:845 stop:1087 length:243 start_codon:yes stop_codon:yes gene_type:complete
MELKKYKPVKSTRKNKKYMILTDKGIVHFGDKRYGQFKDKIGLYSHLDSNDPARKKAYYDRHGKSAKKDTAKFFSHKYLW